MDQGQFMQGLIHVVKCQAREICRVKGFAEVL